MSLCDGCFHLSYVHNYLGISSSSSDKCTHDQFRGQTLAAKNKSAWVCLADMFSLVFFQFGASLTSFKLDFITVMSRSIKMIFVGEFGIFYIFCSLYWFFSSNINLLKWKNHALFCSDKQMLSQWSLPVHVASLPTVVLLFLHQTQSDALLFLANHISNLLPHPWSSSPGEILHFAPSQNKKRHLCD